MAKGITLPITVKNGRFVLSEGDDYIYQLVMRALGEGESDNPFQDIGLGEFMTFDINDKQSNGLIRSRIKAIFTELESDQLAKLRTDVPGVVFEEDRGPLGNEKRVLIRYVNIETQERRELDVPIPPEAEG